MKKYLIITGMLAVLSLGVSALTASANSSFVYTQTSTATATSSKITLNVGSTTSIVTDSYSAGVPRLNNTAVVLLQFTASSSASVVNVSVSYSQDGVDYYQDNVNVSTTTAIRSLTTANSYSLSGNATASTTLSAFQIALPTRYAKVTFTGATANSSIWATILPQREAQY